MTRELNTLYAILSNIDRDTELLIACGVPQKQAMATANERRIRTKRKIRKALAQMPGDPLLVSLQDGGHRTVSDGDIGYKMFWIEPDDNTMSEEEIWDYIDREYNAWSSVPGREFTHAHGYRTKNGIVVITHTSMDI